jgi:hypothetical protein
MIRKRLEVEDLNSADVQHLITLAVNEAVGPLQQAVEELREQLHKYRKVITHKEAPAFFNYDVQPETIIRYIKEEGLPATQRGRLYFIEVEDLFAWQLGRINGKG